VNLGVHTAGLPVGLVRRHRTRHEVAAILDATSAVARADPDALGELVDVLVGDHAGHRIAAGNG